MKRPIKFRGKTEANGHWVYGSLIVCSDNLCSIKNRKSNPWVDPDTVGQFTGLHDRNGQEIYEGDILGSPCYEDWAPEVVIFKKGCFQVKDKFVTVSIDSIDPLDRKIIGNIHDNPELLKSE